MKIYLLTAVAAVAIAAPAQARDGQAYFGVEGGVLFAPDHDADVLVDYTTTQVPLVPAIPTAIPVDALFDDVDVAEVDRVEAAGVEHGHHAALTVLRGRHDAGT